MTEPTDPSLDPAREEAVRRALAEAGGPEPLPPAVASRLDDTLAGLVAERSGLSHPEDPGVVVPLDAAARRRRLRVRALLGAAAAVVAVALAAGYLSDDDDPDVAATSTSDQAPARSPEASGDAGALSQKEEDQAAASAPSEVPSPGVPRRVVTDEPVRDVRPDHLREDLLALQRAALPHPAAADYTTATLTAPADFLCQPADFGAGHLVAVRYAGQPAVVAFRQPAGSNQAAEVLTCGTGDVLHSLTLPAAG